jgi:hypothetical protein
MHIVCGIRPYISETATLIYILYEYLNYYYTA